MLGETNWYLFRFKARHADLRIDPRETILIKGNWRGRLSKVNRYRKLLINSADPRDYPSPGFVPARILIFRPLTVFVAAIEAIEIDLSDVQLISLPPSKKRPITSIFFLFFFHFFPPPDDVGPSVSNERIASTILAQSASFYNSVSRGRGYSIPGLIFNSTLRFFSSLSPTANTQHGAIRRRIRPFSPSRSPFTRGFNRTVIVIRIESTPGSSLFITARLGKERWWRSTRKNTFRSRSKFFPFFSFSIELPIVELGVQFYHGWKVFENEAGGESLLRVLPRLHPPVLSVIIRIS